MKVEELMIGLTFLGSIHLHWDVIIVQLSVVVPASPLPSLPGDTDTASVLRTVKTLTIKDLVGCYY